MGKIVKLKNANNVYTYPITKTEAVYIEDNKTTLKDYLDATAIIKTVGPAQMVTFNDGANNIPVKSCVVNLEPYQEGTDNPSPTNIRPISGRTGLTVAAASKNLAPNYAGQSASTGNGITYTYNNDGSVTINGTATANAYSRVVGGVSANIYLPHGTYKKPVIQIDASHVVGLYVQYVRSASDWVNVTGGGFGSTTFTIDEDYPIIIRVAVQNGTTVDNVRFEPYVYPDSVSDLTWVSPVKTNYPISWQTQAGSIYGGTLNVTTGVLTVDRAIYTFASDKMLLSGPLSGYTRKYVYRNGTVGGFMPPIGSDEVTKAVCNILPAISRTQGATENYIGVFQYNSGSTNEIRFSFDRDSAYDSPSKIYALGLEVAIPLKEPSAVVQLSPTDVKTLLGGNSIYTDAGAVSVEYVADTKLYIDNKIAELQALVSES